MRWFSRDRTIGLIYLAVVPCAVVMILVLGYLNHRQDVSRANRISARAEVIAQNSCRSAAILRDILAGFLPKTDPENLTARQKANLNIIRDAVTKLGPLSCEPAPKT